MKAGAFVLAAVLAWTPGALARAVSGPTNTTPPAISGSAKVGGTVTASPGAWTSPDGSAITFAYQWFGCDPQGNACHFLPYSTQTVTGLQAPVGTTIRVQVTATDSTGSAIATSAPVVVQSANTGPGPTPGSTAKPPTITLVSPRPGSTVHTRTITFVVRVRSTARSVEVNLDNQRDVRGPPGLFRQIVRVNDPQRVRFLVEATNGNGQGKTTSRVFSLTTLPPATPLQNLHGGAGLIAPGCRTCVVHDPRGDDLASPPDIASVSSTYANGWVTFRLVTYDSVTSSNPCIAAITRPGAHERGFSVGCFGGPHLGKVFGNACTHPDRDDDCGPAPATSPNSHTRVIRVRPASIGSPAAFYWQVWVLYPGDVFKDIAPDGPRGADGRPSCWVRQQLRAEPLSTYTWGPDSC